MSFGSAHTKDNIETIIFTPTTSYCCEKPDCVQERVVSYEDMDDLQAKLYTIYSSSGSNEITTTSPTRHRPDEDKRKLVRKSSPVLHIIPPYDLEEDEIKRNEDIDDLCPDSLPHLMPILNERMQQDDLSSSRRHIIEPIPIPPTPPPATEDAPENMPKAKNPMKRFYSKGWGRLRIR